MKLPNRGRQTQLARKFDVSQQAAKKWLDGISFPTTETVVDIANWAGVNANWLLQGSGPKRGNRVSTQALVLDDALHDLTAEQRLDLIDNLRAKLIRTGRLRVEDTQGRYAVMLEAYSDKLPSH